jgi:hypothetical protein
MSSILQSEVSRANGARSRGPVTDAGRLASQANSAKSTGPVTPEGKARSSQNAVRHGILAESVVLDSESVEGFYEVLSTLQDELQPVTSIESRYVETMALAEWRKLRLICLEKEQIAIEIRRQELADLSNLSNLSSQDGATLSPNHQTALAFRALSDESRAQELLNRYEARYDRQYQRSFNGLRAYRADRRKDEKEARRAKRARLAKAQTSAKGDSSVLRDDQKRTSADGPILRDNINILNGESSVLSEKQKCENAERSEPDIG